MSKTKEELNKLKEEVEAVNEKLQELTPEEIAQVNGGVERHLITQYDVESVVIDPGVGPDYGERGGALV